jgi:hypothetical protein
MQLVYEGEEQMDAEEEEQEQEQEQEHEHGQEGPTPPKLARMARHRKPVPATIYSKFYLKNVPLQVNKNDVV